MRYLRVRRQSPKATAPRSGDRPGHGVQLAALRGADDKVATRQAYGDALAALGAERADVVALDGEV